ncbi:BglG family transcription antiterminator [Bacillus sp. SJS]|uniref:BglG family transcription antiterminator n=1 Tax=Bacillus sp. SJS TaxID=1423321 RepID=UPI0004DCF332|nr:BglG family transcription antiterminator [Bacillus sp. SJS]KZZ83485.1 sugar transporter [Bacillus sp. SJS]
MFVTSREKAIIELIIKTSGKHTAHSIAAFLHVSVRTVQRDLKNIEPILNRFDLSLSKSQDKGLSITGKNENIFKLVQMMVNIKLVDLTAEERKLLILIELMEEKEAIKLAPLANDLGISVTTLVTYMDELSGWLSSFGIELSRKKGVGVELIAREDSKRKALASFFLMYFNEELIENVFRLSQTENKDQKVLHYFNAAHLRAVDEQLSVQNNGYLKLADSAYIALIVHICITVQRHEGGFRLPEGEEDSYIHEYEEYKRMKEVSNGIENAFSIVLDEPEIHFLSVIWRGSRVQEAEEVFYDSVVIGRSIKRTIQHVSQKLNIDLTSDFSLFQGLFAHMEPSLFRIQQGLASFNPLTDDIKKKYPVLYMAVEKSLELEFGDIKFPPDEIAYIVLHFGSALELRKEELSIRALVVCPTGIGTSKMLASRIKKEMAEISSIEVASLKEIQEIDLQKFDLVISTVRLPFFQQSYVLVNPLLTDEDIESVRHFLGEHIQTFTSKQHYADQNSPKAFQETMESSSSLEVLLQEMEDIHTSIRMILKNLAVTDRKKADSHHHLLEEMAFECEAEGLLTGAKAVGEQLLARERQAGLGIPDTNMALFHARHDGVKELIFRVVHLDEPYQIKGMDRKDMQARSILLLLAPMNLRPSQLEIVSLISTAIVESKENMLIFSSSNGQMIRRKLEETFYAYVQNKRIKE